MRTLKPELDRIRYWQGQLLSAGDLVEQMASVAEQRRLHDRTVHRAVGVAVGLSVKLANGELLLDCGLAYDCAGRTLLVAETRAVPLPGKLDRAYSLVIFADARAPGGADVALIPSASRSGRDEVVLARVATGQAGPELDQEFRPVVARPLARPRLAIGQTIPGFTSWQPWTVDSSDIGVQVEVDTSAAGFTTTPHYFASVLAGAPDPDVPAAWFVSVHEPTAEKFVLRLLLRRITREALKVPDPKSKLVAVTDKGLTLADSGSFKVGDVLARLTPIVEQAAMVEGVTDTTVTLSHGIADLLDGDAFAIGHLPRTTFVVDASDAGAAPRITLDGDVAVNANDVLVKLGANPESASPARVSLVNDDGSFELQSSIAGLKTGDPVGVAEFVSEVSGFKDGHLIVPAPSHYKQGSVVVLLVDTDPIPSPAIVTTSDDEGIILTPPITAIKPGSRLGIAKSVGNVETLSSEAGELKITVADTKPFRAGDVIGKRLPNGTSDPVSVTKVSTKTKKLTLSATIPGLVDGDVIVAADFPVRSTVTSKVGSGLAVVHAALFPGNGFVVALHEHLVAGVPHHFHLTGQTLTLDADPTDISVGDVLGLCSFPPAGVAVDKLEDDGALTLAADTPFAPHDAVSALPDRSSVLLVKSVDGPTLVSTTGSADVAAGDELNVVTFARTGKAHTVKDTKITLEGKADVRVGDVVGRIVGWADLADLQHAGVQVVAGTELTLYQVLDGALAGDTIGLASLRAGTAWLLRVTELQDVRPGDDVLLAVLDLLSGESATVSGSVYAVDPENPRVVIYSHELPAEGRFRPGDITPSTLFLRGSALGLIAKQDLFVSWLGAADADPTPRPCELRTDPPEPCCDDEES